MSRRFTDAELAAEFWRSRAGSQIRVYQRHPDGNIVDEPGTGWEYERDVWSRFVLLPDYDEKETGL